MSQRTVTRGADSRTTIRQGRDTRQIGGVAMGVQGPQGPPGPAGPPGPSGGLPGRDGQLRYTGQGPPPDVIAGAQPGDTYLDVLSGVVYRLE